MLNTSVNQIGNNLGKILFLQFKILISRSFETRCFTYSKTDAPKSIMFDTHSVKFKRHLDNVLNNNMV